MFVVSFGPNTLLTSSTDSLFLVLLAVSESGVPVTFVKSLKAKDNL